LSKDGRLFVSQCVLGSNLYELDRNLTKPPRLITAVLGPGCALNGTDWFDGFLYGARYFTGEIVRVNVDSGEITTVARDFGTREAVKFDSHGRMYVADALNGQVVRVNIQTGEKTFVAQLELGLDNLALDSRDPGWAEAAVAASDGKGIDLIVDQISGYVANPNMKAAAVLGRIVNVGRLGGMKGEFDFDLHALKRIDYVGVTFRTRSLEEVREIVRRMRADLWDAIEAGKLALPIDRSFPLDEAAAAQAHMRANAHFGKIVLVV